MVHVMIMTLGRMDNRNQFFLLLIGEPDRSVTVSTPHHSQADKIMTLTFTLLKNRLLICSVL